MLTALAIATLAICPTVQFTSDSVYTEDNIITIDVTATKVERSNEYTAWVEDTNMLILTPGAVSGYQIYDDSETDYIDGLRFDDQYVYSWCIPEYDDTIEHTLYVKTVYTTDYAGIFMQAKDGKIGAILSNPLTLLQGSYYTLAAISVIIAAITGKKSKKIQVKNANDIATSAQQTVSKGITAVGDACVNTFGTAVVPVFNKLQEQNTTIIKALALMQLQGSGSSTEILDMLKACGTEDLSILTESIKADLQKKAAEEAAKAAEKLALKQEAANTIAQIASGETVKDEVVEQESDDSATGRY